MYFKENNIEENNSSKIEFSNKNLRFNNNDEITCKIYIYFEGDEYKIKGRILESHDNAF